MTLRDKWLHWSTIQVSLSTYYDEWNTPGSHRATEHRQRLLRCWLCAQQEMGGNEPLLEHVVVRAWDDSLNLIIDYDLTMMSRSKYVRCFRSRCSLLPAAANHIKYRWYSSNDGIFTRMDGEAYSLRPRRQHSTNQTSNRTWTQYKDKDKSKPKADQQKKTEASCLWVQHLPSDVQVWKQGNTLTLVSSLWLSTGCG